MPLYEYRCTECGNRYEKIQKINDEPDTVCPKCGGKLVRPLTAPALQFKGAGWYVNDYASKPAGSSESKQAGESGTSTESKPTGDGKAGTSESKPAATESAPKPASPASTS